MSEQDADEVRIEPGLVAAITEKAPGRVVKRAGELVDGGEVVEADTGESGKRFAVSGQAVEITPEGEETALLTRAEELNCDCLLAPRCAHILAVALVLPVADENSPAESEEVSETEVGTGGLLSTEQRETVGGLRRRLAEVLDSGLSCLPGTMRAALLADLQRLRAFGLVDAERALTDVTSNEGPERTTALSTLLMTLHRLEQGDSTAIGIARRGYGDVGGLRLTPLLAAPVLAESGYAGAVVEFVERDGRLFTLNRVTPGRADDVADRYLAGASWGGTAESLRTLSRRSVLVSHATASSDGRLGTGAQVRVALGAAGTAWDATGGALPEGYRVVEGTIAGSTRAELWVIPAQGASETLQLGSVAARLGVGRELEMVGQAHGAGVRVLIRDAAGTGEIAGVRFLDDTIAPPEHLAQVWWPGLDRVGRAWAGRLGLPEPEPEIDPREWTVPQRHVLDVRDRWLRLVAEGGRAALESSTAFERDILWLRRAGAPFAAELLCALRDSRGIGQRRFDGTWEPDPSALAHAWLRLSQY